MFQKKLVMGQLMWLFQKEKEKVVITTMN